HSAHAVLEAHRSAVTGARCPEAPGPGPGDPAQDRAGLRAPGAGLAPGLFHDVAAREGPGAAPLDLRLGAHAGRLARQVAQSAPVRIATTWGTAAAAPRRQLASCTWGRSDKNRSLPRSDHAGERDCREGMLRQEGLDPVYAPWCLRRA